MTARSQSLLVDRMIDAYVDWLEACLRVGDRYRSWTRATGLPATLAFRRYWAALNQEERAAEVYSERVRRVAELVGAGGRVARPPSAAGRGARPG
jgi:hypothetical protein